MLRAHRYITCCSDAIGSIAVYSRIIEITTGAEDRYLSHNIYTWPLVVIKVPNVYKQTDVPDDDNDEAYAAVIVSINQYSRFFFILWIVPKKQIGRPLM